MLISGIIAGALGWEQVFYIQGGLSILWLIAWIFLTADSPEKQKMISDEERDFIVNSLNAEGALSKGVSEIIKINRESVLKIYKRVVLLSSSVLCNCCHLMSPK